VPFTSVDAGAKYRTEDRLKIQTIHKLNTIQNKKATKQQNITTLVQSLLTTLGPETRWAYSTMLQSPHRAILLGVTYIL